MQDISAQQLFLYNNNNNNNAISIAPFAELQRSYLFHNYL